MKKRGSHFITLILAGACVAIVFLTQAGASETGGSWRSTYDMVMKWVNFSILLFVVVKYAGPPLMNFLRSQGREIERDLARIEQEKSSVIEELQTAQKFLDESEIRIQELKERIIEEGRKRRQEIIDQADAEGQLMLESATQRTQGYFQEARQQLQHELLDDAMDRALTLLPTIVTSQDRQKMVSDYIDHIAEK